MEKAYKHQIYSNLCTSPPMILVLVLVSFYFFFSTSKSFPLLLTIPIALLSTMFLVTLTKKKRFQNENIVQEELHPSLDVTHTEVNQQSEPAENQEQQAEVHSDYSFPTDSESSNFSIMDRAFEVNVQEYRLQDDLQSEYSLPSDSESSDGSIMVESFEIGYNENQNEDISDYDHDDGDDEEEEEDSLIEINLPSSHFPDLIEDPKQNLQSKLPDFLPDSIFKQQGLLELLEEINDMNEDENLIEIDISMGSINNPDFRLKQELAYFEDKYVLSD